MDNQDYHEETIAHEEYDYYRDSNWKLLDLERALEVEIKNQKEWYQKNFNITGDTITNIIQSVECESSKKTIEALDRIIKHIEVLKNVKVN